MADRLLDAVRVLDLCSDSADGVTRLFADLGADVLEVKPPGANLARDELPTPAGASIPFAVHNANKRSAVLDSLDENDCRLFPDLAAYADIVVDSGLDGLATAFGRPGAEVLGDTGLVDADKLREAVSALLERKPHLGKRGATPPASAVTGDGTPPPKKQQPTWHDLLGGTTKMTEIRRPS